MNTGIEIVTAGTFATLILEGVKWIIRLLTKNMEYNFPAKVYVVFIPILSFACTPLLAWLGLSPYVMPTDWAGWGKQLVITAIASVLAIIEYQVGVKSLADYGKNRMLASKPVDKK